MRPAVAVIWPEYDGGAGVMMRRHSLYPCRDTKDAELLAKLLLARRAVLWRIVDLDEPVDDRWPSCGSLESRDPYMMVMDYVSRLTWADLTGRPRDYVVPDAAIHKAIDRHGLGAVLQAAELIPDTPLAERMRRLACASEEVGHESA